MILIFFIIFSLVSYSSGALTGVPSAKSDREGYCIYENKYIKINEETTLTGCIKVECGENYSMFMME